MVLEIHLGKRYALEKPIDGQFGEELGGWSSQVGREGSGVGLWKLIRKW